MNRNIICVVFLLSFTATSLCQCMPTNNATRLSSPLSTSRVITFDNLGLQSTARTYPGEGIALSMPNQAITLFQQGGDGSQSLCYLINYFYSSTNVTWNGNQYWSGSDADMPGYFLWGYGAPSIAICTFYFNPPITAFLARVNAAGYNVWFTIYDSQANPLDCQGMPGKTGINTFEDVGFSSTTPIGYINLFTAGYYLLDNIQIITCDSGSLFNGTACVDVDECTTDPCGEHGSCSNTPGYYLCNCNNGYESNNETCVDVNECAVQSTCSSFATCSNTNGSFTCTCNEGYEGDGIGVNGCQLPQAPTSNQSPSSHTTPDGSTTGHPSSSKPNTPASSIVSSAPFVTATINSLLCIVLAFIAI